MSDCEKKNGVVCAARERCSQVIGTYDCVCAEGFDTVFEGEKRKCVDACTCGENGKCLEKGGCECNSGYTENGDGECVGKLTTNVIPSVKKHEICHQGKCKCKRGYHKSKTGHCIRKAFASKMRSLTETV
ncbi:hypothetical protein OS493_006541 [Desmophyllum pertusum]|uniref:EGF-like domain-containing protein n=1 Tax=Desmophyllum pertusum TaxID=174260 RepID=A0A9X0A530_9CNID|nr:hypothetical protein OS493_006541 [Desmophyllum pertusum]